MFLNNHSWYSLRYGTISIEDLVKMAKASNIQSLALTDINATSGVFDFILACREHKIKPIIGVDFFQEGEQLFVALAKNQEGFREINELLTKTNRTKKPLPIIAPDWKNCFVIYPWNNKPLQLRDYEYIGIRKEELNYLYNSKWRNSKERIVALHTITFQSRKHFNLHKLLRAVDNNVLLSMLPPDQVARSSDHLISKKQFQDFFSRYPLLIKNAESLLEQCNFRFDFATKKNRLHFTGNKQEDKELLYKLTYEGMEFRYGANNLEARRRIRNELQIIEKLNFAGYFLITWDIVRYSQSKNYFHVGRGSGANSIVSYCLGITNICPIELNLYFERFLNPSRTSPPDFDIDWSWQDRDEILDYVFGRYGQDYVAFIGTIGQFKHRSMMRELGKVFGLPKEELDQLSRNKGSHLHTHKLGKTIHTYAKLLERFPNQRSMHACGIVVSEVPITYYTALDLPPKGYSTCQFDMYVAEDIGFDKLDILSQRGLGHIKETIDHVKRNQNKDVKIEEVNQFKHEPQLNDLLSRGKTIGCFYIESPAMRGLLRRLKCDNYQTLVAASSVIRPGVAKSGMMREYIFRHNHPDKFEYFHDVFEEHLHETYGVMVYQEDVMKIAHHFADLNLAEADILRRAMTGKTRSKREFEKVKEKYFSNCREKGYPEKLIEEVYRQIASFAGFSFCKAHSASYSVESYQSLYLKTYYPVEFMTSVINNFGGFYRTEVYIHEARMAGASINLPCVNNSNILATVIGKELYLGLNLIHGLDSKTMQSIVSAREQEGVYKNLIDFVQRVRIGVEQLQSLIFIGAFRWTGKTKGALILEGRMLLSTYKAEPDFRKLFSLPKKEYTLPDLPSNIFEDAYDEVELLGFPVSCSPFDLLKTQYRGDTIVRELLQKNKRVVRMVAYLISRKHVPTIKGSMEFGTWIDIEGAYFDTTHFPDCLTNYPFDGGGCYLIEGRVEVDFHFPTIEVYKLGRLPFIEDPRYATENAKTGIPSVQFKTDYSGTNRAPYPRPQEIGLPRKKMESAN